MRNRLLYIFIASALLMAGCNNRDPWGPRDPEQDSICFRNAQFASYDPPHGGIELDKTVVALSGDWGKAYTEFMKQQNAKGTTADGLPLYPYYRLTYIDDDSIPELILMSIDDVAGQLVASYYNGKVSYVKCLYERLEGVPRSGIFETEENYDTLKFSLISLKDGTFTELASLESAGVDNVKITSRGASITREQFDEICDQYYMDDRLDLHTRYGAHKVPGVDTRNVPEWARMYFGDK